MDTKWNEHVNHSVAVRYFSFDVRTIVHTYWLLFWLLVSLYLLSPVNNVSGKKQNKMANLRFTVLKPQWLEYVEIIYHSSKKFSYQFSQCDCDHLLRPSVFSVCLSKQNIFTSSSASARNYNYPFSYHPHHFFRS